jgi:hypothetical protein
MDLKCISRTVLCLHVSPDSQPVSEIQHFRIHSRNDHAYCLHAPVSPCRQAGMVLNSRKPAKYMIPPQKECPSWLSCPLADAIGRRGQIRRLSDVVRVRYERIVCREEPKNGAVGGIEQFRMVCKTRIGQRGSLRICMRSRAFEKAFTGDRSITRRSGGTVAVIRTRARNDMQLAVGHTQLFGRSRTNVTAQKSEP